MKKLLYILAIMLVAFSSCSKEDHFSEAPYVADIDEGKDPNLGVVVGFDTGCDTALVFDDLHLFFYDQQDQLVRHSYYDQDLETVSLEKMLMEAGTYRVFAVFNIGESFYTDGDDLDLADLVYSINTQSQTIYSDVLIGMKSVTVTDKIEQVIICIDDEPITNIIAFIDVNYTFPAGRLTNLDLYNLGVSKTTRSVIELRDQSGELITRKTALLTDTVSNSFTETFVVTKGEYDVKMWCDYTSSLDAEDQDYNTSLLSSVSVVDASAYVGQQFKAAYVGSYSSINVLGSEKVDIQADIDLEYATASYQVVATDVDEYLATANAQAIADLKVELVYEGYLPTAYNVGDNSSFAGAEAGYSYLGAFGTPLNGEVSLASDYILALPEDNNVTLGVHIYYEQVVGAALVQQTVAYVGNNVVSYDAGDQITISGNFLTAGQGGISVDLNWTDSFDVDFSGN